MNAAKAYCARGFEALSKFTVVVAGVAVVGMAAAEAWQVFARYVLDDAPSWTEPLALLLMNTAMMFGAAAGVRTNRHFGFFILVESAGPKLRKALQLLARLTAAGIGLMLSLWGGAMMIDAWSYPAAGAPLPQGAMYVPLCLGGALIAAFALEWMLLPDRPAGAH